jgi:hypothetical protein
MTTRTARYACDALCVTVAGEPKGVFRLRTSICKSVTAIMGLAPLKASRNLRGFPIPEPLCRL